MPFVDIVVPTDSQEGTTMVVQAWYKETGSMLSANEPIVELETDKVMMEVEAPADGVLVEILFDVGSEVEPGAILARMSTDVEQQVASDSPSAQATNEVSEQLAAALSQDSETKNNELSSAVRRFLLANNLDPELIQGTGKQGRITLKDAKSYLALNSDSKIDVSAASSDGNSRIPHTAMRRAIAKNMQESVSTAPHVTAIFEVDFSSIVAHRAEHKAEFEGKGVKLTFTAYFIFACVAAMRAVPEVNSQWHEDFIDVFADINIGVGTALGDKGLIVPVLKQAQSLDLFGVAQKLHAMTEKARTNKLKPEDVRDGTFTISNHGTSGSLVATPIIINQPQSAILGIGKLEKRAVVRTYDNQDVVTIRPMANVSLTIDHRVLDGYQTNLWLSTFADTLENWVV